MSQSIPRVSIADSECLTVANVVYLSKREGCREQSMVGDIPAVIPEVQGRAWITGQHEFLIDPADPLRGGFVLR